MKLINKLIIEIKRHYKRRPEKFEDRWQKACDKCWSLFGGLPPSKEALTRIERTHKRLMRIAAYKPPFAKDE